MTFNIKEAKNKNSERGFTIVELLIVIIVIGILATLVLIAYNNVQAQARDTKRQADANSLREASESFKVQSTTASYPTNTAAGFYSDMNSATLYPDKTVVIDQSITNKINATAPSASNKDYIKVDYCGTGTPTAATATGVKITYWKETNSTAPTVSTGTGC